MIVAVVAGAVLVRVLGPGPLAFRRRHAGRAHRLPRRRSHRRSGRAGARGSLIKRGEYLARAADCVVCHTAQGGEPYAGGLAFALPFGTLYSTNITPDKATGIGDYSDARFPQCRAARHAPRRHAALPGHAVYRPTPT